MLVTNTFPVCVDILSLWQLRGVVATTLTYPNTMLGNTPECQGQHITESVESVKRMDAFKPCSLKPLSSNVCKVLE